jgi:hypothetical protein
MLRRAQRSWLAWTTSIMPWSQISACRRAWEILQDFQTEVATGNAEPLVEDGLLTKAMVHGSDLSKDFESDPRILLICLMTYGIIWI